VGNKWILNGHTLPYVEFFGMMAKALQVAPPKKLMPKWLAQIVGELASLASIFGQKSILSRETIRTSYSRFVYQANKAKAAGFEPKSLEETIAWIAAAFKRDGQTSSRKN
jgi:hypothetical protein